LKKQKFEDLEMLKIKLLEEMKKKGVSPRQVGEEVGVAHTTINRALRGETVDVGTIIKISQWLKVKPSTLLNSMVDTGSGLPDQIAVMLESFPLLAENFSKAIDALVAGEVDPAIIEDIAAYTAYKINLKSPHS
jgi:transcriptional regulator with XRE-family HTH domain